MPLIVLEGLDGAGKSTQVRMLIELLEKHGKQHEYIHFPRFDAPLYGDLIARFLRGELGEINEVDPYIVALLYAGDRAEAADMIEKWLEQGKFVILDRYVNSNVAFQCAKFDSVEERQNLKDWIMDMEFGVYGIPRPDMSLFLDVPFGFTSEKLTSNRSGSDRDYLQGGRDIHEESLSFQQKVRGVYLWIAEQDKTMQVIDCSDKDGNMASPEENFARVTEKVMPYLTE